MRNPSTSSIRLVAAASGLLALSLIGPGCSASLPNTPTTARPTRTGAGPAAKGAEDRGLEVLSRTIFHRYSPEGALTKETRIQYLLKTQAAVANYDGVGAVWAPWHEARPELEATVRTPDGRRHTLDPATIVEQPVASSRARVLTDLRRLHAKLPALEPGAEVTLVIRERERTPLPGGGGVARISLAPTEPTHRVRVILEAPAALPLRWTQRGATLTVKTNRVRWGKRRVELEGGPFLENTVWEPLLPPDHPRQPYVLVSTSPDWRTVAEAYRRRIAPVLRQGTGASPVAAIRRRVGGDRLTLVAALLAEVRRRLRYTSLAFGENAIIPVPPEVALSRGYGDCKDMSTTLVSWLREAGIPAHLALLSASGDEDVHPDYPGLGLFDHAIVYVPGTPALWLDPTAPYSRPAAPPTGIQDRWALVIRDRERKLRRIPASGAEDNVIREVREIRFQPTGGAVASEWSEGKGHHEMSLRDVAGIGDPKGLRKRMESYVANVYGSKKLLRILHPDPRDLGKPFQFTLEMKNADRAWTDDNHAKIPLSTINVFRDAGDYLLNPPARDHKSYKRRQDLYLPLPFRSELEYRLHAPPAYQVKSLPKGGVRQLGPATFRWSLRSEAGGSQVVARFVFDLGRRRWTAAEVRAFWEARRLHVQENPDGEVVFEHRGHRFNRLGQYRAALDVYRDLHRRAPQEPVYFRQLANALGDFGFGQAARALMDDAVRRFPNSAMVHFIHGVHYEGNAFGVTYGRGWERARTLASLQRATELEPKNADYLRAYALTLGRDERGNVHTTPAALGPALAALRRLREELKDQSADPEYLGHLLRAGRLAEVRKVAADLKDDALRAVVTVTVVALAQGAEAAFRTVTQLATQEVTSQALLAGGGMSLLNIGRLRLAAAFLMRFARARGAQERELEELRRYRSFAHLASGATTPKDVAARLLWLAVADRLEPALFTRELAAKAVGEETQRFLVESLQRLGAGLRSAEDFLKKLPPTVAADVILSGADLSIEGSDQMGYRIHVTRLGSGRTLLMAYLVREGEQLRIRTTSDEPGEIGIEALTRLVGGDLVGARGWLDWQRGRRDASVSPFFGSAFAHLWESGRRAPKGQVELAALVLALESKNQPQRTRAYQRFKALLRRPPNQEARIQILRVLARLTTELGLSTETWRHTDELWRLSRQDRHQLIPHIDALLNGGRMAEAKRIATRYQSEYPSRWQPTFALAQVAIHQRQFAEARALFDRIVDSEDTPDLVANNAAWLTLFETPFDGERGLRLTKRATRRSTDYSVEDTIAVLHAELGQLREAREAWKRCLGLKGWDLPRENSFYAYGRIAEQLGLIDIARDAFQRVPKPKAPDLTSTWELAQRRLRVLGAAAAPMPGGPPRP